MEADTADALLEQKRLFREGTPSEYKKQVEVARARSEKLAELQEEVMTARFTIQHLAEATGPLTMAAADQKQTEDASIAAMAVLKKAKLENLTLRPRANIPYVDRQSVPAISGTVLNEWCPNCLKGFVARAAVLGSCGCLFHNICVAEMINSGSYRCSFCEADQDPAWVAQWDGKLTPDQDRWVQHTSELVRRVGARYPSAATGE